VAQPFSEEDPMRRILSFFLLCIPMSTFATQVERSIDTTSSGIIKIDVIGGAVSLVGWDKPIMKVDGKISGDADDFILQRKGNTVKLEYTNKGGFWRKNRGSRVDLKIFAPRLSHITANGLSVNFDLKNLENSLSINTMSGDIELEGGKGRVDLKSVSGDLKVEASSGKLNLATVSGDIDADTNATQFNGTSVSGRINANIGSANQVNLETVSGDIKLDFALADEARIDAHTVSGDIGLTFQNRNIDASFVLETGPGADIRNKISDHKTSGESSFSDSLKFTLGNGNSRVTIQTMSGTIELEN